MKRKVMKVMATLMTIVTMTLGAAGTVYAYAYGAWENWSVNHSRTLTYSKMTTGSTQTLNNQVSGTYAYYYVTVKADLGDDGFYTTVYSRTKVGKSDSLNMKLINTVDSGKKLQLVVETYISGASDSVTYQYLHN